MRAMFDQTLSLTGRGLVADFALGTVAWTLLQMALFQWPDLTAYKMDRKTHLDFRNRLVSFIHGVCVLLLSGY
jgi:hypothetical protein